MAKVLSSVAPIWNVEQQTGWGMSVKVDLVSLCLVILCSWAPLSRSPGPNQTPAFAKWLQINKSTEQEAWPSVRLSAERRSALVSF